MKKSYDSDLKPNRDEQPSVFAEQDALIVYEEEFSGDFWADSGSMKFDDRPTERQRFERALGMK